MICVRVISAAIFLCSVSATYAAEPEDTARRAGQAIERGAKAVVLSRGVWNRLQVCPETLDLLAKNGIEAEILQTEAAVERFNALCDLMPVGGLFHSTC